MGELRSGADGEIHAPGNAVTVHRLQYVRVHCSTHGRKVKPLITVTQRDLVLWIQGSVIPHLNGFFTTPNEGNVRGAASYGVEISVEMYDSVPCGKCYRRLRTQVLNDVR